MMLTWQILAHARMSPLGVVDDLLDRALRWTRQRGELENECLVLNEYSAAVPLCLGESVRSSAYARQAMVMAEDLASPVLKLSGLRGVANCLLAAGEPDEALEVLDEHRGLMSRFGVDLQFLPMILATRAEAECALGRLDDGLANARRAVAEAERIRAGLLLPDALHALSVAHLARGEFDESDRALDRMEAAARESGAVNHLPRCLWRRADGMRGRGDVEGCEALLRAALAGFEASGAAAYAQRVAGELGPGPDPQA
jgi:tetratricopeptide (TPR) repeat protein